MDNDTEYALMDNNGDLYAGWFWLEGLESKAKLKSFYIAPDIRKQSVCFILPTVFNSDIDNEIIVSDLATKLGLTYLGVL